MDTIESKIENFTAEPYDVRFAQWANAGRCRQNFLDYHRCNSVMKSKGKSTYPCKYFQKVYKNMCPSQWIEKWNNNIEEGIFHDRIEVKK